MKFAFTIELTVGFASGFWHNKQMKFMLRPVSKEQHVFTVFYALTGVALGALITGFGKCLFDIDQIAACADHAEFAFDTFKAVGDHIVNWFIAFSQEIMRRNS